MHVCILIETSKHANILSYQTLLIKVSLSHSSRKHSFIPDFLWWKYPLPPITQTFFHTRTLLMKVPLSTHHTNILSYQNSVDESAPSPTHLANSLAYQNSVDESTPLTHANIHSYQNSVDESTPTLTHHTSILSYQNSVDETTRKTMQKKLYNPKVQSTLLCIKIYQMENGVLNIWLLDWQFWSLSPWPTHALSKFWNLLSFCSWLCLWFVTHTRRVAAYHVHPQQLIPFCLFHEMFFCF